MQNNIGVFSTHYLWSPHFETELEIVACEQEQGKNVIVYTCSGQIKQCELVWASNDWGIKNEQEIRKSVCALCNYKQKKGFDLITNSFSKTTLILNNQLTKNYPIDDFYLKNAVNLKQLIIDDDYKVGWALLSSLVSKYKEPFIDISLHKIELEKLFQDCCRIYYSTLHHIKKNNLKKIYVFNGRLSYTKAILEAALKLGVDCFVHERGATANKYSLFKNHTIHNIAKFAENVNSLWNNDTDTNTKFEIGKQFYIDRENNIIGSWKTFLDNQNPELLPSNWNKNMYNIVLFTSSEDEFVSISDDWHNPYFATQTEGVHYVSEIVSATTDINLYIRLHPNSGRLSDEYLQNMRKASNFKNVTFIDFDSNISTYQLLNNCNKVITFGSTTGFEAVYRNKPSILLSKSLYGDLIGQITPKKYDEIKPLILSKNLTTPAINDAIKLGYYMKNYGVDFKYYKATSYKTGTFKGVDLDFFPEKKITFFAKLKDKIKYEYRKILEK